MMFFDSSYYINDQELAGKFQGKLAERLGLPEMANQQDFFKLCENLTPRTKENRRVGYDINFHCPKSVSILHAVSKDDHLLKAYLSIIFNVLLVLVLYYETNKFLIC
jgi:conjugative relaxase-like TrwC/TraI family protein